ncbi:MAG: GDP-mannose 4,6-dehydratase, partial [Bacteroidales bacterium]
GRHFDTVELWNEPNNLSEYDYMLDRSWDIFVKMIRMASYWAKQLGKKTVLGGMSPIDPQWLKIMAGKNLLEFIDVVGIHGFPKVFEVYWRGWDVYISEVKNVLKESGLEKELWITETGYSTWRYDERKQVESFLRSLNAVVDRVYWYSLTDLPMKYSTVDGPYSDEREYHFGLLTEQGNKKLLYRLWQNGGVKNVIENRWMISDNHQKDHTGKYVLITGGAGFIGTNVASYLMDRGFKVMIFDNLSRHNVKHNLDWLRENYSDHLQVRIADVRDVLAVKEAVKGASHIFHLAAQVAVTTSLEKPAFDYDVNVNGTMNLLETIRKSSHRPSLIFTSTNKVYGDLSDIALQKNKSRYLPDDENINKLGISEKRRLDFHSPYGSSKGSADQYVIDYARSFGMRNVVFRMSCIYGPHQFGNEDQGWVAHFMINSLKGKKINLYGDGMQVRDILYVEDLINAFMLSWKNIDSLKGEAFNIGGGTENSVSLLELIKYLEELEQHEISVDFNDWRKGDQKYYVTDTSKLKRMTGWIPQTGYRQGVRRLLQWLRENHPGLPEVKPNKAGAEIISI